jgi:hypothetical protein
MIGLQYVQALHAMREADNLAAPIARVREVADHVREIADDAAEVDDLACAIHGLVGMVEVLCTVIERGART